MDNVKKSMSAPLNPQRYYFWVTNYPDEFELVEKVIISENAAEKLAAYHEIIDHICMVDAFRYRPHNHASCPKYVSQNGSYLYGADSYFLDGFKIYSATARLKMFDKQPDKLIFRFYNNLGKQYYDKQIIVDLAHFLKQSDKNKALWSISAKLQDTCIGLDAAAHTQNYFDDGTHIKTQSAFPEYMAFNSLILQNIIVTDGVRDGSGNLYSGVRQALVVSSSGYGQEAILNIAFMSDTGMHNYSIALTAYIEKYMIADSFLNPKDYYKDAKHPIMAWEDLYSVEH